ncbi:hypothetical protein [Flavobacterium sp. 102]|uniref:hypothetical protein n=1 Tax=Flavobacterium sp. 102 TaxID=2135623 RepID=UPI000EAC96A0|nr:hypothetical protein [Flavobacterium sp. 102]RKS01360.1 hypothetical protein C8C84_1011 [Flavobacterium sp. 102]
MNSNVKTIATLFLFGIILSSCSNGTNPLPNPPCSATNTIFNQLYGNVVALPGHQNTNTFDTEIHEYTFTFSQTKTICSIGYQSQPAIAATPYLMEIVDVNTNTVIYAGSHVFTSANTSYVSITPTLIIANQPYTIRRTILLANAGNNFANIIGRVVNQPGALVSFPQSFGIMTITGANFYQNGGPLVNMGIPYIDFAYY